MRFLRDAIITIIVLLVVVFTVTYVRLKGGALSADDEPGRLERTVAARLVRLSIPADANRQTSPLAHEDHWRDAAEHYMDHCAVCHGREGRGHTEIGDNMYPKVPDFADPGIQQMSDGALFHVIQNGVRWTGMPAWKSEHTPDDTWALVGFIRHVPRLTSDELESLEPANEQGAEPAHSHGERPKHDHDERPQQPHGRQ
jgi:mono/diheme cytochrome c family protein